MLLQRRQVRANDNMYHISMHMTTVLCVKMRSALYWRKDPTETPDTTEREHEKRVAFP